MDKSYCIFDLDGTLLDSMKYWQRLGRDYLAASGVFQGVEPVLERIRTMTLLESSNVFMEQFALPGPPERLVYEMNAMMEQYYKFHIPLKPGVKEFLVHLQQKGVRLGVATAADETLAKQCLTRLDVHDFMEFIISCETMGQGKDKPDVFLAASDRFEAQPQQCAVFEDALYAVKTAKAAGFYVVAVYDTAHDDDWNEIKEVSDTYITDWRNLL